MAIPSPVLWGAFAAMVVGAMALDLGLKSHRHRTRGVSFGESARWTVLWVVLACLFGGLIYFSRGRQHAMEFFTAYLLEESLSADNMFVFVLIFEFFRIPSVNQHRILKYGIIGAIIMRIVLILAGIALLDRFHWIFYVFGAILIATAIKMLLDDPKDMRPGENWFLKIFRRFVPVTSELHGEHFFVRPAGRLAATPLFAALVVVEASDLIFSLDSIPACLAVSKQPLIILTSNIFAVMGLRSLYFMIHGMVSLFRFLRYGLAIILIFIGSKMCLMNVWQIPIGASLSVVAGILAVSVACSVFIEEKAQ